MRAPVEVRKRAKDLRAKMSPPEVKLWACLKSKRFEGLKFRNQHPVGPYVLDFYCPERRLAIEVDGLGHDSDSQATRDASRDRDLLSLDIHTLRVTTAQMREDMDGVLDAGRQALAIRAPSGSAAAARRPSLLPRKGGRPR